jgi:hypothetical protein
MCNLKTKETGSTYYKQYILQAIDFVAAIVQRIAKFFVAPSVTSDSKSMESRTFDACNMMESDVADLFETFVERLETELSTSIVLLKVLG